MQRGPWQPSRPVSNTVTPRAAQGWHWHAECHGRVWHTLLFPLHVGKSSDFPPKTRPGKCHNKTQTGGYISSLISASILVTLIPFLLKVLWHWLKLQMAAAKVKMVLFWYFSPASQNHTLPLRYWRSYCIPRLDRSKRIYWPFWRKYKYDSNKDTVGITMSECQLITNFQPQKNSTWMLHSMPKGEAHSCLCIK